MLYPGKQGSMGEVVGFLLFLERGVFYEEK